MIKTTLTIGIPAHNEAKTIKLLIQDILNQTLDTIDLQSVIIISDGSTDKTVKEVKEIKDSRVHIYERTSRLGKAVRQNEIFEMANTDVVILFDGDVRIPNKLTVKSIIAPIRNKKADLTSGEIVESESKTFLEDILSTSMKLKAILFATLRSGSNVYHCHGPIRAFSRKLYTQLRFETNEGEDMYSYFACVSRKLRFAYVKDASVVYRLPNTMSDHTKQSIRYAQAKQLMYTLFDSKLVKNEFSIPMDTLCKAAINSLKLIITHPIQTILYLTIFSWLRLVRGVIKKQVDTWSVISTKMI